MVILDQYGDPWFDPTVLPEINLNITVQTIQAKSRKLKSTVTMGAAQDLRSGWGSEWVPEPISAIDRLGALAYSAHRDAAQQVARLPDDLIPADVKDMALNAILGLIPQKHWPSAQSTALEWEKSVIGIICAVTEARKTTDQSGVAYIRR